MPEPQSFFFSLRVFRSLSASTSLATVEKMGPIEEQAAVREEAIAIAERVKPLSWPEHMQALHDAITTEYVPRYQSHADAARARGRADEESVCLYMVEHEKAQVEFTRRELAGASLGQSLEPLVRFLRYPIKR